MNKQYAIFHDDCEIIVTVLYSDDANESMNTIRDFVIDQMDSDTNLDKGYIESYPFWKAEWEITGYGLPSGFDTKQIIDLEKHDEQAI